jgi:hypothetical protein
MPVPLLLRHHRRLLLLVVLVASLIHGGSSNDAYDTSICLQQPKACGGVSINYPFYLSEETGVVKGNNNSYCGYPGLAILCEDDDRPIIQLNGENYNVTDINYEKFTVSVADPDVFKSWSCPRAEHNTTVPPAFWLSLPPDNIDYLFFFVDCSFTAPYINQPSAGDQITCQIFGDDAGPSFVFLKDQVPPGNWSKACKEVLEVPVVKSGPIEPNKPGWRSGGYGSDLRRGFQLVWNEKRKLPSCIQCEGSKGQCGYNETGGFVGCLCPDGRVNSDYCSSNSAGMLFES